MPQGDLNLANQSGAAFRADLNNQLLALGTLQSGTAEPSTTYAFMLWADIAANELKQRNAANNGWITIGTLDAANLGLLSLAGGTLTGALQLANGTAAAPSLAFANSTGTGIYRVGSNELGIATNGVLRLTATTAQFTGTLPWRGQNGTAAAPAFSFSGNTSTGVYLVSSNVLGLAVNGGQVAQFSANELLLTGTGGTRLHVGTTAERPAGSTGMLRFNSTLGKPEIYDGSDWGSVGGGATGGGSDDVFIENGQTVTQNYTLTAGKNAVSAGPITINAGVTVTVPSGSNWVVV